MRDSGDPIDTSDAAAAADDDDDDGLQNVGSIRTPDTADSLRISL
jgi:hypothetical protein